MQLLFCVMLPPVFLCSCAQTFFSIHLFSAYVVHLYSDVASFLFIWKWFIAYRKVLELLLNMSSQYFPYNSISCRSVSFSVLFLLWSFLIKVVFPSAYHSVILCYCRQSLILKYGCECFKPESIYNILLLCFSDSKHSFWCRSERSQMDVFIISFL